MVLVVGTRPVEQAQHLRGGAAVGERQHDVAPLHATEVAVHGVGWMQEERPRAGAGQGGRDFLADDAGLAHAGHHHHALAREQEVGGAQEGRFVEPVAQFGQSECTAREPHAR